jgi:hypothetical protein
MHPSESSVFITPGKRIISRLAGGVNGYASVKVELVKAFYDGKSVVYSDSGYERCVLPLITDIFKK